MAAFLFSMNIYMIHFDTLNESIVCKIMLLSCLSNINSKLLRRVHALLFQLLYAVTCLRLITIKGTVLLKHESFSLCQSYWVTK